MPVASLYEPFTAPRAFVDILDRLRTVTGKHRPIFRFKHRIGRYHRAFRPHAAVITPGRAVEVFAKRLPVWFAKTSVRRAEGRTVGADERLQPLVKVVQNFASELLYYRNH
jgi:hypothetical protein